MNLDLPEQLQRGLLVTGRSLLGLYFVVPGLAKIFQFSATGDYMAQHGVPAIPLLLVLTILVQVGGGVCLAIGYRAQLLALLLAGLTLLINLFMHDFWNVYEGTSQAHETQNFIKNLGIMAGLLVVAGTAKPRAAT